MAPAPARAGLDDYPRQRGLAMGAVVLGGARCRWSLDTGLSWFLRHGPLFRPVVAQISQTNPQMMMKRIRHTDSKAKPEQSLGEAEGPHIAIAPEQRAGDDAPYQRGCGEHEIGQMRRGEEHARQSQSRGFIREKTQQPVHEIVLQKKLLVNGPQHVAGDVSEVSFVERVKRSEFRGDK